MSSGAPNLIRRLDDLEKQVKENERTIRKIQKGLNMTDFDFDNLLEDLEETETPETPEVPKPDTSDNAMFRGFIDAAYLDETSNTPIIVDWKTGKLKSKEHQSWQQLLFYATVLFKLMPYDRIVLMYAYVEHDKVNTKVLHRKDLHKYEKALMDTIFKVENDFTYPKNETPLCNYCEFQAHCVNDTTLDGLDSEEIPF